MTYLRTIFLGIFGSLFLITGALAAPPAHLTFENGQTEARDGLHFCHETILLTTVCLKVTQSNLDCTPVGAMDQDASYKSCTLHSRYDIVTDHTGKSPLNALLRCTGYLSYHDKKSNSWFGARQDIDQKISLTRPQEIDQKLTLTFPFPEEEQVIESKLVHLSCHLLDDLDY